MKHVNDIDNKIKSTGIIMLYDNRLSDSVKMYTQYMMNWTCDIFCCYFAVLLFLLFGKSVFYTTTNLEKENGKREADAFYTMTSYYIQSRILQIDGSIYVVYNQKHKSLFKSFLI